MRAAPCEVEPMRGRDPRDRATIDLEELIAYTARTRADRLRAAYPGLAMVQLPLMLHEGGRR